MPLRIDEAMRAAIAQRLVAEYGDCTAAALTPLGRWPVTHLDREASRRAFICLAPLGEVDVRNERRLICIVTWHGLNIGHL